MLGVIGWIILGLIVASIGKVMMPGRGPRGFIITMLLGSAGALMGGFIGRLLGWYGPYEGPGLLVSVAGAIILPSLYAWFNRGNGPDQKRITSRKHTTPQIVDEPTVNTAASHPAPAISPQLGAAATRDTSESPAVETSKSPAPAKAVLSPGSVGRRQKIFLSYRREDSADVAGRIYDRLVQQFGKEQVFKDVDSIPLGVDFRKHLAQMVGSCDILLAVIGNDWQTADRPDGKKRLDDAKDFVRIELETALQRDIPVIPVLVRGAQVPEESELPSTLATLAYRNGMAVRADPDFHRDMDRLIEGVQSHLSSLS